MRKIISLLFVAMLLVSYVPAAKLFAYEKFTITTIGVGNAELSIDKENWHPSLELSTSEIGNGKTIYVKADSSIVEDSVTKNFWKWGVSGGQVEFTSDTSNETTFTYHGGNISLFAQYKSADQKVIKYYTQCIYTNKSGETETGEIKLELEKLKDDTADIHGSNKQNYEFDKLEIYEYDNQQQGDKIGIQEEGHPMGMSDNYQFERASGDRLVKFYYLEKLDDGNYRIKPQQDFIIIKVKNNGTGTFVEQNYAKAGDTVQISVDNDKVPSGNEFSSWSVVGNGSISVDNPTNSETEFTMIDRTVSVSAILKPSGKTTCEFISEQYFGETKDESYTHTVYKIGDVTPISDGGRDTVIRNGQIYKLKNIVLSDTNNNVIKEYTISDLTKTGEVIGYYKNYENAALIPNGYTKLYYRAYYELRSRVGTSATKIKELLPADFSDIAIKDIVLNVDEGSVSADEKTSIIEKAGTSGNKETSVDEVFDLTLYAGYEDTSSHRDASKQITDMTSAVSFDIYLSDEELAKISDTSEFKLIRIHNDKVEEIDATLNDNKLSFASDGFSTYAIVSYKTPSPAKPSYVAPKTGIE